MSTLVICHFQDNFAGTTIWKTYIFTMSSSTGTHFLNCNSLCKKYPFSANLIWKLKCTPSLWWCWCPLHDTRKGYSHTVGSKHSFRASTVSSDHHLNVSQLVACAAEVCTQAGDKLGWKLILMSYTPPWCRHRKGFCIMLSLLWVKVDRWRMERHN